jgi:hypothetical protein
MRFVAPAGWVLQPGKPLIPDVWIAYYNAYSPPGFQSDGTAFLGERRTPGGRRVLVAIDTLRSTGRRSANLMFHAQIIEAGSIVRQPRRSTTWGDSSLELREDAKLRFGNADPEDQSHITLEFETAIRSGTIDVWVRNDLGLIMEERREEQRREEQRRETINPALLPATGPAQ